MLSAPGQLYQQAKQIPAAIRDINASLDPTGAYLQAAGRTAGEGGGQAIASVGMMKAPQVAGDVAEGAINVAKKVGKVTPKQAAQIVGGVGGGVAGHGTLSAPGAYYGAKTAGRIAEGVLGEDRANAPIFGKAPEPPPSPSAPQSLRDWWASRGGGLSDRPIDRYEMNRAKANSIGLKDLKQPEQTAPQTFVNQAPQQVRSLPPGQYQAPASPLPPQAQLGSGVIEGEYMPEPQTPQPIIRGALRPGVYQQPGGFEPNQLALPQRGSPIQLPAASQAARQPIIRTSNTAPEAPSPTVRGLPKAASDAIDKMIPPENATLNMMTKSKVKFYLDKGDVTSAQAAIEDAAKKVPGFKDNSTPAVQAGPEVGEVPEGDMTDMLKKSLDAVRRKKGLRPVVVQ
jgi:hypothetical protein